MIFSISRLVYTHLDDNDKCLLQATKAPHL